MKRGLPWSPTAASTGLGAELQAAAKLAQEKMERRMAETPSVISEYEKPQRVYIAGPMRGIPKFNFPAFDEARDKLAAEGYSVVSPADLDRAAGFHPSTTMPASVLKEEIKKAIKRDCEALLSCDLVVVLDGWHKSKGASAELALADWAGIPIKFESKIMS